MKKYDRLIANDNIFVVDWTLSSICNYKCSYCPPNLRDGKDRFPKLEDAKRLVDRIFKKFGNKKFVFILTGGEPTLWKKLPELMKYMKEINCEVRVTSNGSLPLEWWEENSKYMDMLLLSFHWEFCEQEHIMQVARIAVRNNVFTKVNILTKVDKFDESYKLAEEIAYLVPGSITEIRTIRPKMGKLLDNYSDEQLKRLKEKILFGSSKVRKKSQEVYIEQGERLKPQVCIAKRENSWKGWKCHVGLQLIKIYQDGSVFRGNCRVGGKIGDINGEINFPSEPIICSEDYCKCTTDIMTTKERV
jgi:organic radical activating enzyme